MKLDKGKIEAALLKNGLSTKKSIALAAILVKEDLLEDEKLEVKAFKPIKKKEVIKTKDISEVNKKEE